MVWKVDLTPSAGKGFDKLDKPVQKRIREFVKELEKTDNPRLMLEPYSGPLAGYWKKRFGDYRIICDIQDKIVTVLIVNVGHRSKVYR